jgi:hypothetical protein
MNAARAGFLLRSQRYALGGVYGQIDLHAGAVSIGVDPEGTAKLANSFAHGADAHSCSAPGFYVSQQTLGHSPAAILDLDPDLRGRAFDPDPGHSAPGMTVDIRQTLLHHAENRNFQVTGKPPQIVRRKYQINF